MIKQHYDDVMNLKAWPILKEKITPTLENKIARLENAGGELYSCN